MSASARYVFFAILSSLIGIVVSLTLAEIGLRFYADYVQSRSYMDPGLMVYDAQLGWRMAPNWSGVDVHYDFDVKYTTNNEGLRGTQWPAPAAGNPNRIAVMGDSFTFGIGVEDDATFVQQLQAMDPLSTYLNAGIPGYSTDQQLLYLRDRLASWQVEHIVLVVYLGNDLFDNELHYPLQAEMAKPLFQTGPGGLTLTNVPVPQTPKPREEQARSVWTAALGREVPGTWRSRWQLTRLLGLTEPVTEELLAGMPERLAGVVDLFVKLIAEINGLCTANNVSLTLVLLPGSSFVEQPGGLSSEFQQELRHQILRQQPKLDVVAIDLAPELREIYEATGERLYFPNEGHLNPRGHRAVAELIRTGLEESGF